MPSAIPSITPRAFGDLSLCPRLVADHRSPIAICRPAQTPLVSSGFCGVSRGHRLRPLSAALLHGHLGADAGVHSHCAVTSFEKQHIREDRPLVRLIRQAKGKWRFAQLARLHQADPPEPDVLKQHRVNAEYVLQAERQRDEIHPGREANEDEDAAVLS